MTKQLVISLLLVGSFARADRRAPKRPSVVGRIVGLEIVDDETAFITVAAGSQQSIGKTWHARFRDGKTEHLLGGGDAVILRLDPRTSILKTRLPPDQIRANHYIQFDP